MLVYVDDALLGDILQLALSEFAPPLEMTANVLAAAAVIAAVRHPDWAAEIASGADGALIGLAERIANANRETYGANPKEVVDRISAGLVSHVPASDAKAG